MHVNPKRVALTLTIGVALAAAAQSVGVKVLNIEDTSGPYTPTIALKVPTML